MNNSHSTLPCRSLQSIYKSPLLKALPGTDNTELHTLGALRINSAGLRKVLSSLAEERARGGDAAADVARKCTTRRDEDEGDNSYNSDINSEERNVNNINKNDENNVRELKEDPTDNFKRRKL